MLISQPLLKKSAVKIHDYMWYFLHSLGIDIYIFLIRISCLWINQRDKLRENEIQLLSETVFLKRKLSQSTFDFYWRCCRTSLITVPDVLICQLENCLGECKMKPKGYWSRLYTVISISSLSHTRFVFKLSVSLFNVTFRCWYCCWLVYIWKTGCYGFLGQDSKTLGCWNSRTSSSVNW